MPNDRGTKSACTRSFSADNPRPECSSRTPASVSQMGRDAMPYASASSTQERIVLS